MAQTGYTPIQLYYSVTPSAQPVAGNLVLGELALNAADGKLFYKDSSTGVVTLLADKSSVIVSLPLSASQGGTGRSTLTVGSLLKGNGTSPVNFAVSGVDYAPPSTGTSVQIADGSGGFVSAPSPTAGAFLQYVGPGTTYAWNGAIGAGSVTFVGFSAGASGLTISGSPITTTGTITISGGLLAPSFGGTGLAPIAGDTNKQLRITSSNTYEKVTLTGTQGIVVNQNVGNTNIQVGGGGMELYFYGLL